ncbi:hypothetical protein [Glycomyces artemisiae]|nr:hypothetical protein [Glycomyces artemisiae]
MSIEDVAPVFERINSTGTPLTIVDLMRAATWKPTFDLVDSIDRLSASLEPKQFDAIDRKTLLRAIASAAGHGFDSASIDDLRHRSKEDLLAAVNAVEAAAKRTSDFLATEIGVPGARALPYVNQFAVLCELFRQLPSPTSKQYDQVIRWFWRTTLGSYFGGWNTGQMTADRDAVTAFANGDTSSIQTSASAPAASIWSTRDFRSNSATSKMMALMLGQKKPVDLITGQAIDVAKALAWNNDKEFHHFFPRGFLKSTNIAKKTNVIANIVMLTSMSNIRIRDRAPSEYLRSISQTVGEGVLRSRLRSCMVPEAAYEAALADDYMGFLAARSSHLQEEALRLAGLDDPDARLFLSSLVMRFRRGPRCCAISRRTVSAAPSGRNDERPVIFDRPFCAGSADQGLCVSVLAGRRSLRAGWST